MCLEAYGRKRSRAFDGRPPVTYERTERRSGYDDTANEREHTTVDERSVVSSDRQWRRLHDAVHFVQWSARSGIEREPEVLQLRWDTTQSHGELIVGSAREAFDRHAAVYDRVFPG